MMRTKKAGAGGPPVTRTTTVPYRLRREFVNCSHKIPPTRPDRRVALPPAQDGKQLSDLTDSLALLVLGLQTCTLSARQERKAWGLVAKWLNQLVAAKHEGVAA